MAKYKLSNRNMDGLIMIVFIIMFWPIALLVFGLRIISVFSRNFVKASSFKKRRR